jgi:hypothetical protein
MTSQETLEKMSELQMLGRRAVERYELAMAAFRIACARHDWMLAEKEQQAMVSALTAQMDAIQAVYRLQDVA